MGRWWAIGNRCINLSDNNVVNHVYGVGEHAPRTDVVWGVVILWTLHQVCHLIPTADTPLGAKLMVSGLIQNHGVTRVDPRIRIETGTSKYLVTGLGLSRWLVLAEDYLWVDPVCHALQDGVSLWYQIGLKAVAE